LASYPYITTRLLIFFGFWGDITEGQQFILTINLLGFLGGFFFNSKRFLKNEKKDTGRRSS
jgi:hypothetical protein